jgi:hypothetical protein
MPECVATWPEPGVPLSAPVAVLKLSQAGLFAMLKEAVLPVVFVTAGVKRYAVPTVADDAGVPLIFSAAVVVPATILMAKAGSLPMDLPSLASMTMLAALDPTFRVAGAVPVIAQVLMSKEIHVGRLTRRQVTRSPFASLTVGLKEYALPGTTLVGGEPESVGAALAAKTGDETPAKTVRATRATIHPRTTTALCNETKRIKEAPTSRK